MVHCSMQCTARVIHCDGWLYNIPHATVYDREFMLSSIIQWMTAWCIAWCTQRKYVLVRQMIEQTTAALITLQRRENLVKSCWNLRNTKIQYARQSQRLRTKLRNKQERTINNTGSITKKWIPAIRGFNRLPTAMAVAWFYRLLMMAHFDLFF